ncbi:MAG TPA: Crp/Fnr family transcriptional regulator [Leptolyngbyaceae cyanobacterium M33_DOE_097]|uniref:Crp/Fnr family transcriptional regulator n=1 Tax=Oscillatoriales cyanobacterium SpSt-418 TaxID=2282169 RepID=A0A7C3KFV8_9CYAN|nr:Crp/Fnr family transcriptional regulator [Leptolyngbyaceae cyanobacterium M33_DOE_097]
MSVVLSSHNRGALPLRQKFSMRSPLPVKQQSLWRIEAGAVRTLTWLEDGTPISMGLWGPGDIVGQALSTVDPYQIECLTAVEASLLPLNGEPVPNEWILNHLRQAESLLIIRSCRRVDLMLVKLLGFLAKRFGREVESGNLIDLRLTHQDLAELMGTTRVTVTRILGQFEEQGLIERLSLHRIVLKEYETWHYEI